MGDFGFVLCKLGEAGLKERRNFISGGIVPQPIC